MREETEGSWKYEKIIERVERGRERCKDGKWDAAKKKNPLKNKYNKIWNVLFPLKQLD